MRHGCTRLSPMIVRAAPRYYSWLCGRPTRETDYTSRYGGRSSSHSIERGEFGYLVGARALAGAQSHRGCDPRIANTPRTPNVS